MVGIVEIKAGYEGAKAAFEIARGVGALKTEAAVNGAIIDIQRHVVEAQQGLSASLQTIDALEKEIVRLKDWSAEKERYELKRFEPGSVAYSLKPAMAHGEPPHLLCPNCYQRSEKSFLQATGDQIRRYRVHRCPSCKAELALGPEMPNEMPPTERQEFISPQAPYDRLAELRDE